jgi:glucose/arabinose dehydrogenase
LALPLRAAATGERFAQGAFIARHGSWNRRPLSAMTWSSSASTIAAT